MFVIHSPPALAAFHTAARRVGLVIGLFVVRDLLASRRPAALAALFLAVMAVANLSGFLFPSRHIGVGHVSGAISVAALVVTTAACALRCAGTWAPVYALGVVTLLYCDSVIAVFMMFGRVPFLHQAGQGSVLGIQLLMLGIFVGLGLRAVAAFHPDEGNDPDLVTIWRVVGHSIRDRPIREQLHRRGIRSPGGQWFCCRLDQQASRYRRLNS